MLNWYRCSFKLLTKERAESGRTKHLPIQTADVFASSPDECVGMLREKFLNEETFDVRDVRCRVLRNEWSPAQMAFYLQQLQSQIVHTSAGDMRQTEAGILAPV